MRRNWDVIREELTRLEDLPNTDAMLTLSSFTQEQASEYSYHMELLIEAGLLLRET
jgi:hypothetical protein